VAEGSRPGDPGPGTGEAGYTLLEILVVMLIMGILAAIAIPTLIEQRGKAQDSATRQDASRLGKAVVGYFLDHSTAPTVAVSGGRFLVQGEDVGAVSSGVVVAGPDPSVIDVTGWTASAWCLALTNPQGVSATERYTAQQGLEPGACTSPTAP
jgi:prepilin-type N-terminal cleavage/methylation domain-containing protein